MFPVGAYEQAYNAGTLDGFAARLSMDDLIVNSISRLSSYPFIILYPNPVNNWLFLEAKEHTAEYLGEIFIYSTDGKLVKRVENRQNTRKLEINVQHLPSGIYQIVANGFTKRFIKI